MKNKKEKMHTFTEESPMQQVRDKIKKQAKKKKKSYTVTVTQDAKGNYHSHSIHPEVFSVIERIETGVYKFAAIIKEK